MTAASWGDWLHRIRSREIELIFARCPEAAFGKGLELGAGDGFQSRLLSSYVKDLVCTDFSESILAAGDHPASVAFAVCDAERVDEVFAAATFDLVYSSNLLEHLPRPDAALRGMHRVLKREGLAIHVVPNPVWKLSQLVFFYPDLAVRISRRLLTTLGLPPARRRPASAPDPARRGGVAIENNPKASRRPERHFWPTPHGAYESNLVELYAYSRRRWLGTFADAGFRVLRVLRGPAASGYGFGLERARRVLERAGVSTESVYVAAKDGHESPLARFF
ncbi:MAG: class I SAM-dependent methyltransferase [Candidatus Rokubacteria bacterium]|nr:class I SAM-dependent methyltransferase [Candidatus Rokubacteria bacterium]